MPCSWLRDAYAKELNPPTNAIWLAGISSHDGSNGEMTTRSRRSRQVHAFVSLFPIHSCPLVFAC